MRNSLPSCLLACFVICSSFSCYAADEIESSIRNVVFRIDVKSRFPQLMEPWARQPAKQSSGSGLLIEGNRIITNAHVVEFATQVYVMPDDSDQQWKAKVTHVAPMMDLAILELEDPTNLGERRPLEMNATRISVGSDVTVYGYPVGGERLSMTKGIVSRHDFRFYPPYEIGLRTQIDAAINPGNSGGPALQGDKVIGLANGRLTQSDNIGFIIPVEEIEMFLQDIDDGKYDGQLFLWDTASTVENKAQRRKLKLDEGEGGLRIEMLDTDFEDYPLQVGDVMTKIGEFPLDLNGNVRVDDQVLVSARYAFPRSVVDGKVRISIIRDGERMELHVPGAAIYAKICQPFHHRYPEYAIFGPLPFTPVSFEFVSAAASLENVSSLLTRVSNPVVTKFAANRSSPDEELVLIPGTPWSHPLMKGYGSPYMYVVESVNGVKIRNLKHLVEVIRDCTEDYLEFDFAGNTAETYIFDRQEFLDSTEDILSDNNIRDQFSNSMRDVWEARNDKD